MSEYRSNDSEYTEQQRAARLLYDQRHGYAPASDGYGELRQQQYGRFANPSGQDGSGFQLPPNHPQRPVSSEEYETYRGEAFQRQECEAPDPHEDDAPSKKGKKKRGGVWNIVFYVSLAVAVVALAALGILGYQYLSGRITNGKAADLAGLSADTEVKNLADLHVDWQALLATNPDTVGWIFIPGTVVNYPIVQAADNDAYLYKDFYGKTSWNVNFGTIFLDYRNASDFSDSNNMVYGHHMNDGSMFSAIADMLDSSDFNEHRTVYILTPAGNLRLTGYSVLHIAATEQIVMTSFGSESSHVQYVQDKIDRSEVTPNTPIPSAKEMGRTFMFSTCDNDFQTDGRIILCCYVAESTIPSIQGLEDASSQMNGVLEGDADDIEAASDDLTDQS